MVRHGVASFPVPASTRPWQEKETHQDPMTPDDMRKAMTESLAEKPPEKVDKKTRWSTALKPPEDRTLPVNCRLTLPTYHRLILTMERLGCGLSQALEAMLQDVEAQKVAPIDQSWRKRYRVRKGSFYQSFDLYRKTPKSKLPPILSRNK